MNHQSSQFEMRNHHGLTLSPMTFLFGHSLKTLVKKCGSMGSSLAPHETKPRLTPAVVEQMW
jgi:hypothetical protein